MIRRPFALLLAASATLLQAQRPPEDLLAASDRIKAEAFRTHGAYQNLASLCDGIGHRLAGSLELDKAITWAQARMKAAGLSNVHTEPVMVPHWVRGAERAEMVAPRVQPLHILGLGGSVGTPAGGLTADVVVVGSFAELDRLGEAVKGKIVLYDVPYAGYGPTVAYRFSGASRAAKWGAVAALVRSVGPVSLDTPHTGLMAYDPALPKIPTASVTLEAATQMRRMQAAGLPLRVHLEMGAQTLPDVPSANVVGEIPGAEKPNEVILLSGHLDSWDVGQGAQDDGAGCVISLEAARLIKAAGLRPRRTVRVVFFVNEENGVRGGNAYLAAHRAELPSFVAAAESDSGSEKALGFSLDLRQAPPEAKAAALAKLQAFGPLLERLGAGRLVLGGSGEDVGPVVAEGVPGLGMNHAATHYFDIHHTEADTLDKVDENDLAQNAAILGTLAYALAQSDVTFR
ncbi:MAG TPA: M20/M25/M40 family metallo-hydrolase [Holophagaceae bacterium]